MSSQNICDPNIGDTVTLFGENANCTELGPEWILNSQDSSSVTCQRISFTGDPVVCCSNDLASQPDQISRCFSDNQSQNTCAPEFRSILGSGCKDSFQIFCLNGLSTEAEYLWAWQDNEGYCPLLIQEHIFNSEGQLQDSADIEWAQQSMASLFTQYYSGLNNGLIIEGADGGTFQNFLYNFCLDLPAACETGLNNLCSQYSLVETNSNVNITNLCGCHLQESQYTTTNQFSIPVECTPICVREGTVQRVESSGQTQNCMADICIIDDVTLEFIQSQGGNVTFSQICGGCAESSTCQCKISGVSLNVVESEVGNINFQQECQGTIECFAQNPDDPSGPAVQVPCSSTTPSNGGGGLSTIQLVFIIVAAVLVILIIGIFSILGLRSRRIREAQSQQIQSQSS